MDPQTRAIRGATTVPHDDPDAIREATRELLREMLSRNTLSSDDVGQVLFTLTPDLTSEFPARAARDLGWTDIPLLCMQEIAVPGALPRCIRVLMVVATRQARSAVAHVYLRDARGLRPDLAAGSDY